MARMSDVAKKAGVSTATVSRVLNQNGYYSREARDKVLIAVQELNYIPNIHAERLRTGTSKTIAFIVTEFENPYWSEVATGAESVIRKFGYDLILFNTGGDPQQEIQQLQTAQRRGLDGILVSWLIGNWNELEKLKNRGIPIVILGRSPEEYGFDIVTYDNKLGGYLATEHLVKLGHKKIAYVSADFTRDRELGYQEALKENDLPVDPNLIFRIPRSSDIERGKIAVRQILETGNIPTGIFAYNDMTAIAMWMELESEGFSVPADISLVGFDNIQFSKMVRLGLTSIGTRDLDFGSIAANFLIEHINNRKNDQPKTLVVNPQLIIRGSTAKVKAYT